jgi:hypothetical protein
MNGCQKRCVSPDPNRAVLTRATARQSGNHAQRFLGAVGAAFFEITLDAAHLMPATILPCAASGRLVNV